MKILFFGEGSFAKPTLEILIKHHNVVAIFTTERLQKKTRKQKNRPITELAEKYNIKKFSPQKLNEEMLLTAKSFKADAMIVSSYGLLIPESFLNISKFPPINTHPSALPRWRGAAPIERTIENGDDVTKVCIIEVIKKLDQGSIYKEENVEVANQTSIELSELCANISAKLTLETLEDFEKDKAKSRPQNKTGIAYAKKINKAELLLDFSKDVKVINDKIKAFSISGGAYFVHQNKRSKIFDTKYTFCTHDKANGCIDSKEGIIYCKNGFIEPTIMQAEGKNKIKAQDFWKGFKN